MSRTCVFFVFAVSSRLADLLVRVLGSVDPAGQSPRSRQVSLANPLAEQPVEQANTLGLSWADDDGMPGLPPRPDDTLRP